jgi:PBP1b-binding outer membrane lipoprotein LpoB
VVAAVLLLAGCSGDTDDPTDRPAPPSTTSTSVDPAATTTTVAAAPGSTIDTDFAEGADPAFCALAGRFVEQFTSSTPPGDVQGFGRSLQESRSLVEQMRARAPGELTDDVVVLAQVLGVVVDALEAAEFDLTQVDPEALEALQDPDFQAAAVRLQAYAETACPPPG